MALSKHSFLRLTVCFLFFSVLLKMGIIDSQAQITLDGSLGPAGALNGPDYVIPAEVGRLRGANLYHSFGTFNVRQQERATFTGPANVDNIIGRVTGGSTSFINGHLESKIARANVFLLNPSGVIFGPNADLDISGAFHVSTADYLRLADGKRFSTHLSERGVLSAAAPTAFGFLGSTPPAAITIKGSDLKVPMNKTLSAVGGKIRIIGGTLVAPGGRIQIASVASPGEVPTQLPGTGMTSGVESFERLGPVRIVDGSTLNANGDGGGEVIIRGGRLLVSSSSVTADTLGDVDGAEVAIDMQVTDDVVITQKDTLITAFVGVLKPEMGGAGNSGDIRIKAGRVKISDAATLFTLAFPSSGERGNIVITTENLRVTGGASLNAGTIEGSGGGGDITVTASESVTVTGSDDSGNVSRIASNSLRDSRNNSLPDSQGSGGHLTIETPTLRINDGVLQAGTFTNGDAGVITIRVGRFTLTGGAQILADTGSPSNTDGSGHGGTITVNATEAMIITGRDEAGISSSIVSQSFSAGDGGRVDISAPSLMIMDGGAVGVSASGTGKAGEVNIEVERLRLLGDALIASGTVGVAEGGNVTMAVDTLTLSGGARIASSTAGSGAGGTVTVQATDSIRVTGSSPTGDPSRLTSTTTAAGKGGNLQIEARHLELADGGRVVADSTGLGNAGTIDISLVDTFRSHDSSVTTASAQAGGGNITLTAERVHMTRSALTATVLGGAGGGGDVTVRATAVTLNNSQVIAQADAGRGGNIDIVAEDILLADPTSLIDASADQGIDGTVDIQSPVINVSSSLAPLSQTFSKTSLVLSERCVSRVASRQASRFLVSGRDSVPIEPGGVLPSPIASMEPTLQPPHATGTTKTVFPVAATPQAPEVGNQSLTPGQSETARTAFVSLEQECGRWLWKIEN